jgi:hypothetical protein
MSGQKIKSFWQMSQIKKISVEAAIKITLFGAIFKK